MHRAKEEPGRGEEGAGRALPTGGKKWFADLDGCVGYFPYHSYLWCPFKHFILGGIIFLVYERVITACIYTFNCFELGLFSLGLFLWRPEYFVKNTNDYVFMHYRLQWVLQTLNKPVLNKKYPVFLSPHLFLCSWALHSGWFIWVWGQVLRVEGHWGQLPWLMTMHFITLYS